LHFGIGSSEYTNVDIIWPSGIHQKLAGVKADQFVVIEEAAQP
jgi:hypothetical protein